MICVPAALVKPAKEAGIKTPPDNQLEDYDHEQYPHWHCFCVLQLGAPMPSWSIVWDNAKVVAAIPEAELKTMDAEAFYRKGFSVGMSVE